MQKQLIVGLKKDGSGALPSHMRPMKRRKEGGVLLSGLDNGVNFLVDEEEERIVNQMPFDPLTNEEQRKQLEEQDCGMQFSHTIEEQIGGQLEAGFILNALYEDTNGEGRLHELGINSFLATRAVKISTSQVSDYMV